MIIIYIFSFFVSLAITLNGVGSSFKGKIAEGILFLFFGALGMMFSGDSIYKYVSPEYQEKIAVKEELAYQDKLKECLPKYKMIKKPFYGESYAFICSNGDEMNVSKNQYESKNLELKDYVKTDIDKYFNLILMAFVVLVAIPSGFLTYRFVFLGR
ncbi:TPA: hypothetical protein U2I61_004302 [Providencia rettgeri]|nr:hypothetical protein [Providencia rettgeri]HEM7189764.1 hypothetical protein [Providencia rettgeri]